MMNGRSLPILVTCWPVLLAPALCGGGLVDHACGCSPQTCSHESDCDADPCAQMRKVTHQRPRIKIESLAPTQAARTGSIEATGKIGLPVERSSCSGSGSRVLAAYDSDIPLLL